MLWGWLMSVVQPQPPKVDPDSTATEQTAETSPSSSGNKDKPADDAMPVPSKIEDPSEDASLESLLPTTENKTQENIAGEENLSGETELETEGEGEEQISAPPKPAAPAIPERTVEVVSGALTYTLSNRGGVITSVGSRHMKSLKGEAAELVPHEEGSIYPMTLVTDHTGMNKALAQSTYETDSPPSQIVDEGNSKVTVSFHLKHATGLTVDRTYTFEHGNPVFKIENKIEGSMFAGENLQYRMLWGPGLGGSKESQADYIIFSGPTTFLNNERLETSPGDMKKDRVVHKGDLKWTGFQNKYFAAAMLPVDGIEAGVVEKHGDEEVYVGLQMDSVQSSAASISKVYVGTKELEVLENAGDHLVRLIDYGWFGNKFAFLVKPILKALNFFYGLTGNYGWSIIFLTFVIKLLFFPLTHKSFKSMKGMQKVQPYVKIIQERHKGDRQKMTEEMMELYRKHNVSPMGGCLPMLLQIPVFIALYHALFFSIELRGAPFMLWITDLSEKDPFFVTPVIMGATMILQQKMTPTAMDPMQAKIMMMMPIVFTFLFITFPAGLVIYWTINNILTIAQQYYIYKVAKD